MSQHSVGLSENSLINSFIIYPNPTNGVFQIKTNATALNSTIKIYNVLGELVYSQNMKNSSSMMDLRYLEKGVYFIKLFTENNSMNTKKLILE